jgi:hypothetical protein
MSERWGGYSFTEHSRLRLAEMGLHQRDVLPVLLDPEISYQADRGRRERCADRRRLSGRTPDGEPVTLVVSIDKVVITVTEWTQDCTEFTRAH